jgi:hypothetical protein
MFYNNLQSWLFPEVFAMALFPSSVLHTYETLVDPLFPKGPPGSYAKGREIRRILGPLAIDINLPTIALKIHFC